MSTQQTSSGAGEGHAAPAQRTCKATRLLGNVPIWAKGLLLPGAILVGLISANLHIHAGVADLSRKLTHFSSVVRPAGVSLVQLRKAMTEANASLFHYVLALGGGGGGPAAEAARRDLAAKFERVPQQFDLVGTRGEFGDDQRRAIGQAAAEWQRYSASVLNVVDAWAQEPNLAGRQLAALNQNHGAILGKVEAVVGPYIERRTLELRDLGKLASDAWRQSLVVDALLLVAFVLLACIGATIVFPMRSVTRLMRAVAAGDPLAAPPAGCERKDEVGQMINAISGFHATLDAKSKALEAQLLRFDAVLKNMFQGVCLFDADLRLAVCNARYREMYALPPELTRPGTPLRSILEHRIASGFIAGTDPQKYLDEQLHAVRHGEAWNKVVDLADGRVLSIIHKRMPDGGSLATHEDITERRRAEARISHMAHHDALTDLPNRTLLRERLEVELARVRQGEKLALHFIDLDQFKTANDTLGHAVGDKLLQAVAARLCQVAGDSQTVARLGGDEFALLQTGTGRPEDVMQMAQKLIGAASEPYDVDGHRIVVGASIGIALAPADGDSADQLLRNADLALYRAKETGRGTYHFFEPKLDERMQMRRSLESELRTALAMGQLELHFQPLIAIASGNQVVGAEALMRWRHPERGLISPAEFIPLAEETGLIGPMGEWAIRQACETAAHWPPHVRVAVNLSPVQFKRPGLFEAVTGALAAARLAPERLELEITESLLLDAGEAVLATLNALRRHGVRIALDDFGTGYSSLSYLQRFPFDKIKIDRSFVRDIATTQSSNDIVRAMVALGRALDMAVTAEGIETEAQLALLRRDGCTEGQGYLFSPPRPAKDIEQLFLPETKLSVA